MTSTSELLAARVGKARARFLEDVALALKDDASERSQIELEESLAEQIDQGRRLLGMANVACRSVASATKLQRSTHQEMIWALTVAVKAFRDLQEMMASWSRSHGVSLAGEEELGSLVLDLNDRRAELSLAGNEPQDQVPPFDPELTRRASEEYDRGDFQELGEVIRDLQGPSPQSH